MSEIDKIPFPVLPLQLSLVLCEITPVCRFPGNIPSFCLCQVMNNSKSVVTFHINKPR